MSDYISREAAIKLLAKVGVEVPDSKRRTVAKCINGIELLSAADVEPVRHGAVERTRWIPCSERLPDSSGKFLCCCDGEVRTLKYWRTCQEFQYGGKKRNVTHWMPLPEPPEEGEAGNGK